MKPVTFNEKDLKRILQPDTKGRQFWRATLRAIKQLVLAGGLFVTFFVLLNSPAYYQQLKLLAHPPQIKKVAVNNPVPTVPVTPLPDYPPSISIPKLGITAPMIVAVAPNDVLTKLQDGVIQYDGTALPGQIGNMVIVGHSSNWPWIHSAYNTIFATIPHLAIGDQIIVPYQTQQFIYEVTETKIVNPTNLAVLDKTDTPTLTLLTCYPIGTTKQRYLVLAKLVSGGITGSQTTSPNLNQLPGVR